MTQKKSNEHDKTAEPVTRRRILIVEDDAADRAILRRLLREHEGEYELLEATSGAAGLELYQREHPDCVLLDFYLSDMTGADFISQLHGSRDRVGAVPVALLTAKHDPGFAARVLASGAQDYILKGSLNSQGLAQVIENVIEKHRLQRSLEEKKASLELRNWELEMLRDELQTRLLDTMQAADAKNQFMSVMSHEMRTPLNAILGYVELMDMGIGGEVPEGQRSHLDRIRVGSRHLLDLINDVLDLARAEAGRLELELRSLDLFAVLQEVVGLLERQAEIRNIEVKLEPLPEGLPLVRADLQRLRQILTNLIGNAIKFTEHGSVTIRCFAASDDTVRIQVVDTGIGIPENKLHLIFDEFYQADGKLTRRHGGSGLGLSISRRLARLMGGDVFVQSKEGAGSTFTLMLRAAARDDVPEAKAINAIDAVLPPPDTPESGTQPRSRVTVLAYADDPDVLDRLGQSVHENVRLVWTTNADEIERLAREQQPSLVILDASAGNGAAWRAAHRLHEIASGNSPAVLLLPHFPASVSEDLPGGFDLGWVALVPKPFTAEQLTNAVRKAVLGSPANTTEQKSQDVLIVDDDADSRRVAVQFLRAAGANPREAIGGEEALLAMRADPPDVVVLDLMMPVLDGFGVLAAMRLDPVLSAIPVVVLSAKTLTDQERSFLTRATVRVFQKGEHRLTDVAALVTRVAGNR